MSAKGNTRDVMVISKPNPTSEPIRVEFSTVKKAQLTLRALNHRLRRAIIELLEEKKKLTVTEIYVKLKLEQSVASQHLAILRRAQIVNTEREGKFIFYTLNKRKIDEVVKLAQELAQPE